MPRLASRPADLVVAAYAFLAIGRKRGTARYATRAELLADEALRSAVAAALGLGQWDAEAVSGAVEASLDGLTREGVLLQTDDGRDAAYFLPTPVDRRAMARLPLRTGSRRAGSEAATRSTDERPGIVAWYESAIGTVPPFLVEELREAEDAYPAQWIEEAFREAAALNHRSWRYVLRILERWAEEGRDGDDAKTDGDPVADQRRRYFGGRWSDLVR